MQFSVEKKCLIEDRRKKEYKNNNFHVFIRIAQTIYIVAEREKRIIDWMRAEGNEQKERR